MNGEDAPQTMWSGAVTLTEGPFAGWTTWSRGGDPYETLIGPFYFRDEDGRARCVFEPQRHHLNGGGSIHGGCLMSFADFALFAIAHNALKGAHAVTLTFSSEFVGAGGLDGLVEAHGEIIRDARSVTFCTRNCDTGIAAIAFVFRRPQEDFATGISRGFGGIAMRSPGPAFDLRAALTQELRAAIDELDTVAVDPKAVHRCRVGIKRARALARIGRACAPGLSSVFVDSARALMRNLALARDPAALSEAARSAANKGGKRTAEAFETVAHAIEATVALHPTLNAEAARAGMKDLLALAQVWPEASHRQIRRGARRLDRQARRARRRGLASVDPVARHKWRIREKDRFFAASILGDAWPGKRRRKTAEKIGTALGAERDALLLMEHLVAEPELAADERSLRRALKSLNRRRAKFAKRADALAARMRARD